ncbi:hypothetical protein ASPBRDRAFT_202666 [Aspergillus brasiliensis CBS 101740]|uniref:Aflatoxin regulatory protein domain-containing protein n=1 Tax=Aspergillus brasiliensis (strain CBS 101740 / IMI 381727 / IBT 21946) TaxID=767769 RepID=A0A1L9V1N1_ASPBC|nr:hypothetical protein ASPBRDRAFT_202666 [Aspergillus brasiliensis CBS 101740]
MGRPRKSKRSGSQEDVEEAPLIGVHQLPELLPHPPSEDGGPRLPLAPVLIRPGNDLDRWASDLSQLPSDQTVIPAQPTSASDPHFGPPLSDRRRPAPTVEGQTCGDSFPEETTFMMNIEGLWSLGSRGMIPPHGDMGLQHSATVTNIRLEVYDKLSPLLFQLTQESQALKQVEPCPGAELDSVFFSVSSLCDIIHSIARPEQDLGIQGSGSYSLQSRDEVFVLALTAVLVVLEIYELLTRKAIDDVSLLEQTKSGEREVRPIPSSDNGSSASPAGLRRGLHTNGRLDTVVRYTVMDFHLGQLRRLLESDIEGSRVWQPNAMSHIESTRGRLDALRRWIQDLISQA